MVYIFDTCKTRALHACDVVEDGLVYAVTTHGERHCIGALVGARVAIPETCVLTRALFGES